MTVFANGLEISAKAQGVKAVAVFPDVCFTPPQAPPTPPGVPIPYPNFGFDSDLTKGTGTVKIGNKEVSQENASCYSKCSGDEAGSAPKKGIITSKNKGKVYAQMWSMNVKAEGKGVVRFSDIATSNHGSGGNTAPIPVVGKPGMPGYESSLNCLVGQYGEIAEDCNERGGQAHHIVPDEYLREGKRGTAPKDDLLPTIDEGCAVCVGGFSSGTASSEASPSSDRGKANKQATIDKGAKYAAENPGGIDLTTMRGHGFMHQFDERFRKKDATIKNAKETANELLDEIAVYEDSAINSECAEVAKACVEGQLGPAEEAEVALNKKRTVSERSSDKRAKRLKLSA